EVAHLRREIDFVTNGELPNDMTVEDFQAKIATQLVEKQNLETLIKNNVEKRATLQGQLDTETEQLKELQRVHRNLVEAQTATKVKIGKFEVQRENSVEQLMQNYELTFEAAQLEPALEVDLETARRKVGLLSQSIKELGDVNVSAIEEYETVAERHEFLSTQRTDLLEAKDTLHEAIREMDVEMTHRFGTTFKQIRAHFQEVFKELFGGGKADLVLLDPDNLLESGIEIVAQPPGKKLQNLALLSGGERAFTAIALLFAILKTRPVPFCILDEVEAALDEANVARYSQY
ncbi:MAG: chromosome segregation protein SMC, partial [Kurthia sp.]